MNRFFIICILSFFALAAYAQKPDTLKNKSRTDSLIRKRDSVKTADAITKVITKKNKKKYNPDSTHSPGLAFRRSGFIPGWGQWYNRRWWKVPIVYTGLGLLGSAVVFNQKYYKQYLRVYNLRRNGEQPGDGDSQEIKNLYRNTTSASTTALENAVNGYQRNMQLSVLGILGAWGIQMIDAYIDAKFIHSYTMDRDLSFRITPGVQTGPLYASNSLSTVMPVVKVSLTF
ncbi:DUF5683 domain-containing protein [Mucilaginibacter terrae]|uniref:DUF5683 domain-containing protein n=1 Tax=Mucilaginibacter terrae TaxID=1955052 RepID=A0ABU3GTC2_9SPHI|nr:DUF5683 domain-containing protein [Mucilaginibacter terrae]MDT3403014.1 hypothetical protein [Mucilaginibacter terrae]